MTRTTHTIPAHSTERKSLRRRVKLFYQRFNQEDWRECFALIDPLLPQQGKPKFTEYAERMQAFKEVYGSVRPWTTRVNLHLDATPNQRDKRPFAYVYLVWQDDAHSFHMFRERWIFDREKWFTRVVGLVPNQPEQQSGHE